MVNDEKTETPRTGQRVVDAFHEAFDEPPALLIRAPGRVNLIGEHTDYNDGFVLPLAINRAVWIALRPRADHTVSVYALDFDTWLKFSLQEFARGSEGPIEYVKGVTWALQQAGYETIGWEGTLLGDVPIGAGLSSSAALEMAVARVFMELSHRPWEPEQMARIGQIAENQWVGVNSGIMDQMISAAGQAGSALLIDCRSLHTEAVPLPHGTVAVVLDTGTRRGLVGSAYNERRQQCETAARAFDVPALRDISPEQFEAGQGHLDELTRRRARHVVMENERVLQAKAAMQANDAARLGALMNASHNSLRDDFEVSSDALNAIVDSARSHPAAFGARMTGGGFGGCAVALVDEEQVEDFVEHASGLYHQATGNTASIYVTPPTNGAEVIALEEI